MKEKVVKESKEEEVKESKKEEEPISKEAKERLEEIFGKDVDPARYFIHSNVGIKPVAQKGFFDILKKD